MKITHVSLRPTQAAEEAGCPSLTPEMMAATGARYSRNGEGLEAILSKVDFGNEKDTIERILALFSEEGNDTGDAIIAAGRRLISQMRPAALDASVDSLFRMLDYGHFSISQMAPVAMFIDGVSVFMAYVLWSISPTASGQESSTRYLRIRLDGLVDAATLGIPEERRAEWTADMQVLFDAYEAALAQWERVASEHPEVTGIPSALLDDPSDKARKTVARMKRNFAFDRARPFLPVAAATNVFLLMSAGSWAELISRLLSMHWPEARCLGETLRERLALSAPRMIRHARRSEATAATLDDEFADLQQLAAPTVSNAVEPQTSACAPAGAYVELLRPRMLGYDDRPGTLARSLRHRPNRYALVGSALSRTTIRFGWEALAIAEIRDMNRHRPGFKFCPLVPQGFYAALDQVPAGEIEFQHELQRLEAQAAARAYDRPLELLRAGDPTYVYHMALGTQVPYEHTTQGGFATYLFELRTGLGAHYAYARACRQVLDRLYEQVPELRRHILEGSGEPE